MFSPFVKSVFRRKALKALIIGAAGFVGGYLINELNKSEYTVLATKLKNEKIEAECEIFDLDVTDAEAVFALINAQRPEKIFHLAAQSSVKLSWDRPELTVRVNVLGSLNVLEACKRLKDEYSPTVLMIGSAEEYGKVAPESCPITEAQPCNPSNIYALTKQAQNGLAKIYADAYKMNIINVRAFNHTGPGQATAFVVSDFCSQAVSIEKGEKEPVLSVGNLEARRDFTDVRDIVRAYVILAEKGESGQTYNVGSGNAVRIADILDKILSFAKCRIEVRKDPARMRPSDVPIHCADISKISRLGWKAEIPIAKTIEDTLDFFRNKQF